MIKRFQLSVLNDPELTSTWPEMCNDPRIFIREISKFLFVSIDQDSILENIIISSSVPDAEHRGKLWVKTSWPYGIGFVADGQYKMDYGCSGFPVKIPFLHKEINPKPEYLEQIGSLQLKEYGMENLQTNEDATDRMLWYYFNPPTINL